MASPTAVAVEAAISACEAHHAECCKATAAHWLDDADLCETGRTLYRAFVAAEKANRIAQWGDALPVMADRIDTNNSPQARDEGKA